MAHTEPLPNAGARHGDEVPSWQSLFSSAQWEMFQREDRQAGRNIVSLMTAIFVVGLVGYLFVAMWVSKGWS